MNETTAIVLATALGPLTAVLITLWNEQRSRKRLAKQNLFFTLATYRKSFPIRPEWANALNMLDIVYADHPKILSAWHSLYEYTHVDPLDQKLFDSKRLHLLSEIAKSLGYKTLDQIDLDRYYIPRLHSDESVRAYELQAELLRVLKATERLSVIARKSE